MIDQEKICVKCQSKFIDSEQDDYCPDCLDELCDSLSEKKEI